MNQEYLCNVNTEKAKCNINDIDVFVNTHLTIVDHDETSGLEKALKPRMVWSS